MLLRKKLMYKFINCVYFSGLKDEKILPQTA